jgi:hypothetical protein
MGTIFVIFCNQVYVTDFLSNKSFFKKGISLQNCFTFSLVSARKRVRRHLLTSIISADNITICDEEHVARELLVDGTSSKMSFKIIVSSVYGKM